ncbi:pirin family protein [candidate division GN15 bacterium]|nr:pirin family protein [candidate division GN15 bacterium]
MITIRKANERGHANHGWLDTYHTFSFASYRDAGHMRFRVLRVINEDRVAPGKGFGTHPHNDMEIITYVLDGALEHKDSMGNGSVIRPGDVQHMSAGTGVMHSEFTPSETETVHLYQIWLFPRKKGIEPGWDQKSFADKLRDGGLVLVASPDGADGSLTINQDARLYSSFLGEGERLTHDIATGRHIWLQVARGVATVNGISLEAGDGAAISDETTLQIEAADMAEILLFDLP